VNDFLRVEDVVKDYPSGETTLRVLKGITLEIEPAKITAIVGPSGAGKSTLLHILGFLDRPTSGDVYYRGRWLSDLDKKEQARTRNSHFGFVFQMYHLLPELTARENTLLPLMIRHSTGEWLGNRGALHEKGRALLARLGLAERLHHLPSQLSGGERQRVAIARALANDPALILADEPTGNLDSRTGHDVMEVLHAARKRTGATLVLVTHNLEICEGCDRHVKIHDGKILP